MNFYPRPPRGGRLTMQEYYNKEEQFLSTPSARRATASSGRPAKTTAYFYPRPPRGGRPVSGWATRLLLNFYPRPPRGGRPANRSPPNTRLPFLSTPSARRATGAHRHSGRYDSISIHALREEGDRQTDESQNQALDFYPRPPRGGRLARPDHEGAVLAISIHALREEGDLSLRRKTYRHRVFLSTPSARRATLYLRKPLEGY